jgi:hypothetical protein
MTTVPTKVPGFFPAVPVFDEEGESIRIKESTRKGFVMVKIVMAPGNHRILFNSGFKFKFNQKQFHSENLEAVFGREFVLEH